MTSFRYSAYDSAGALRTGEISAACEQAALAALTIEGKYPVEIRPALENAGGHRWWELEVWSPGALAGERLAALIRDLATLLGAQVPLEEGLRLLREQRTGNRQAQRVVAALHMAVLEGASLSDAMAAAGGVFPSYVCQLVRSGERSGGLGSVLAEIADFLEATAKRRAELGQALLYPAILLVAAAGALCVVVTILVPTIMPLFRDAGVAPPRMVQLMAQLLEIGSAYWVLLLAAIAAGVVAVLVARRTEIWQSARDRLLLAIPGVSSLVADAQTARLAHTLGTLLHNGVPLLEAVRVTEGALDNRAFRAAAVSIAERLKSGSSLSEGLAAAGLFADMHVSLVAIGERTGGLDAMLQRIGEQSQQRVEQRMRGLMTLLAPALTLIIGGVVGGLILSVMGAITSLNDLVLK